MNFIQFLLLGFCRKDFECGSESHRIDSPVRVSLAIDLQNRNLFGMLQCEMVILKDVLGLELDQDRIVRVCRFEFANHFGDHQIGVFAQVTTGLAD